MGRKDELKETMDEERGMEMEGGKERKVDKMEEVTIT